VVADERRIERKLIHFEGFTLDLGKRGLFRGQERLHLTAKPLETLIFLVENRGLVVEKQEILDTVWKDTFVTEDVLVQAIREIRRVLEDDKDNPCCIQTVPRRGYRFIGDASVELPFVNAEIGERTALTVVPRQGRRKWTKLYWEFAAFTGILIAGILVWFVWKDPTHETRSSEQNSRSENTFSPQSLHHFQTGEFPVGKPAFSPDGELILYVGSSDRTRGYGDILIMSAAGGDPIRVSERANPSGDLPVFTGDGSHVVFSRARGGEEQSRLLDLYVVPSSGGEMKLYLPEASGAGFSPDGKWVAYTKHLRSRNVLWLSPTNDLSEHREVTVDGFTPRWSFDGKWIAYTTSNPNGGIGDLWIVDADTLSERKNLTRELQQLYGLTWTSDSRSIVFSSKRTGPQLLWRVSIDDGDIQLAHTDIGDCAAPSISSNGRTLIFHNVLVTKDLMLVTDLGDKEAQQVTHNEYHQWLRLSPSGEKAASIMQRPDFGEHLYVTDLKTKLSIRLSDVPAHHPVWLDEENVAYMFHDAVAGETKVEVVNITSKVTTPLTQFSGLAQWLAVHPDKRKIAVVLTSADGQERIVLRDLDSETEQILVEGGQYRALRWRPDGSAISWSGPSQASTPATDGIWAYDIAKRQVSELVSDGYGPVWGAGGKTLYYSRGGEFAGLWQFDTVRQQKSKIHQWEEVSHYDLANGRLLYAKGAGRGQIYSLTLSP